MKRSHKAIILIFFLLSPLLATYSWIVGEKYFLKKEIKKQIIQGINKEDLVRLTFTREESKSLSWKEKDEFEFKCEMYDVVYVSNTIENVTYWCWWDNEETELNKKLKELLENAMGNSRDSKVKLFSIFTLLYVQEGSEWEPKIFDIKTVFETYYFFPLKTASITPPTPPPLF